MLSQLDQTQMGLQNLGWAGAIGQQIGSSFLDNYADQQVQKRVKQIEAMTRLQNLETAAESRKRLMQCPEGQTYSSDPIPACYRNGAKPYKCDYRNGAKLLCYPQLQNLGYVNYSDSAGLFDGLQNLGYVNYSDSAGLFDGLQNLGLKFSDPWLMNLDADAQLMSLESNPANDPWRNGMTDYSLQNLITLQGAKDLYGKAKGTGLFNLEQDQDLQDLQMVLGRLQNLGGTGSWAL